MTSRSCVQDTAIIPGDALPDGTMKPMDNERDKTELFNTCRPRLRGIAYRMLGTAADADEVVQDAWLRWHEASPERLDSAEAWLVTVVTRLSIDRLRAAKTQREHYVGAWLPEPLLQDAPRTPEQLLERADDLSMAFLMLLERLAPEARAAFLLRDVFDAEYEQVAHTLGKSEATCRQLVHRARAQLQDPRPRHVVAPETHLRLMREFAQAASSGNIASLRRVLAEDAQLIGDGGGKVPSFGKPLLGGERISRLYFAVALRHGPRMRVELAVINGSWGLLRFIDGQLESTQSFETDGQKVVRIHVQRNPEKLASLNAALLPGLVTPDGAGPS